MSAAALAPALVDFASWLTDIGGRALREEITADQVLVEMRQYQAQCDKDLAAALAKMAGDRARIDAAVELLPRADAGRAAPPPAVSYTVGTIAAPPSSTGTSSPATGAPPIGPEPTGES